MGVRLGDVVYQPTTGRPAVDGAGCAGYISAAKRGLCGRPAGGAAGGGGGSHGLGAAIAAVGKVGADPAGSAGGTGPAGEGRREAGASGWWGGSTGAIPVNPGGSVGGAWSFAGSGGSRAATSSFDFGSAFVTAFFVAAIGGGI